MIVFVPYKRPHLMALGKMITQLVLAIEPHTTIRMSAVKKRPSMFLHMTAELSRTTEGASAPVRTLGKSSDTGVVDLAVNRRDTRCDSDLGRDVGLRSDGYIDGLWVNGVDISRFDTLNAIDVGKSSIVGQ